jgi:hypothetical protein
VSSTSRSGMTFETTPLCSLVYRYLRHHQMDIAVRHVPGHPACFFPRVDLASSPIHPHQFLSANQYISSSSLHFGYCKNCHSFEWIIGVERLVLSISFHVTVLQDYRCSSTSAVVAAASWTPPVMRHLLQEPRSTPSSLLLRSLLDSL